MEEKGVNRVTQLHRDEVERLRGIPLPPQDIPEIDLPETPADPAFAAEWDLFRQELPQLLAQGKRGRFALIKAGCETTVWDSLADAVQASRILHGKEPCLVQEIQPYLRAFRVGYNRLCHD